MRALTSLFILIFPLDILATEFEIFTLTKDVIDEPNALVYYVDQGDLLLDSINELMLSAGVENEEQGKRYVTPELTNALRNQVAGLLKAAHYQLKYFPAIVVDGRYVIYGTTDASSYEEVTP